MSQPTSVHSLYKRLERVGQGAYGSVYKGVDLATGNVVALKIIDLDTDSDDVADIQREVALLTRLRDGPNITKYYGCHLDDSSLWIVMDFASGGSVLDLMKASPDGALEEKYAVVISREVLVGLNYLHKSSVIHRDLKGANVLITATGKVMICDFGVSALLATNSSKRNTLVGTPFWMAPEVAQGIGSTSSYDTKADIWSTGIFIYEMITGGPPHMGIPGERALQLIPRSKPPRFSEAQASKDLRDFIPFCLTESPADRLTAEDLLKTKWIKSSAKNHVAILKDLILRYDTWKKANGDDDSSSGVTNWDPEDPRLSTYSNWEFDTVRGGFFNPHENEEPSTPTSFATVRPPAAKLPTSLRLLFDNEESGGAEPFSISGMPVLGGAARLNTPSPLPGTLSPAISRDRNAIKKSMAHDSSTEDGPQLSKASFAFPVANSRARSRLGARTPGADDDSSAESVSSSYTPMDSHPACSGSTAIAPYGESGDHLHPDIRTHDINTSLETAKDPNDTSSSSATVHPHRTAPTRSRSKSSITDLRERAFAFPAGDFQFPPTPSPSGSGHEHFPGSSSSSATPTPNTTRSHDRNSPTRLSTSSATISIHSNHHPTHSLDTSLAAGGPRHPPPMGPLPPPPPLGRARSATPTQDTRAPDYNVAPLGAGIQPVSRKPSLTRLASVAVMETMPMTPPSKPFAKTGRGRSGSSNSGKSDVVVPGLKDVLKLPGLSSEHQMGMFDLLPPSPSAVATEMKTFTPTSSGLSNSVTPAETTHMNLPTTNGIHPTEHYGSAPSSSPPKRQHPHSRNPSLTNGHSLSLAPHLLHGPPIQPLDFKALMTSHEETHTQLAKIVDDLAQWLSVTELGLTRMLENSNGQDRIEEEQEDATVTNRTYLAARDYGEVDAPDDGGGDGAALAPAANV